MFLDSSGVTQTKGIEQIDGLYCYAMILTLNHVQAEDLVQETYVRALQAVNKLRPDSNLKRWLFTILRNIWLNQLRKSRKGPQVVAFDEGDDIALGVTERSVDSHSLFVSKIEAEQVRAAIQKLPVEFREIILLREYEEFTYREIASVLACPIGTVMSRLGRARSKLRTILLPTFQKRETTKEAMASEGLG